MAQRLHLVFGGELVDPSKNVFKDVEDIDIVGGDVFDTIIPDTEESR